MSFFGNVFKTFKKAVTSDIVTGALGAASIVFPAAAPLAIGLAVAKRVVKASSSKAPPAQRAKALALVRHTQKVAASNHPHAAGARRALAAIKLVHMAHSGKPHQQAEAQHIINKAVSASQQKAKARAALALHFAVDRRGIVRRKKNQSTGHRAARPAHHPAHHAHR